MYHISDILNLKIFFISKLLIFFNSQLNVQVKDKQICNYFIVNKSCENYIKFNLVISHKNNIIFHYMPRTIV